MISKRLNYIAEKEQYMNPSQCGFRPGLGTTDIFLRLENLIRRSIQQNKYCLVAYLDLKGAFDCVWHTGLIYKLAKLGIKGNLIRWIYSYITGRKSQVRVGGEISQSFPVTAGVTQGGVLSPVLFNLMLTDIPKSDGIEEYCYADDLTFAISCDSLIEATRLMQKHINLVVRWLESWGMVVSQEKSKSAMQVFSRKRNNATVIRVKNVAIPNGKEQRLLGLIFDAPNLTFGPHIKFTTENIRKRINIMKILASTTWGACRKVMRLFYTSYIRSKLEYGSCIYGYASTTNLEKLNKIQNAAMRMITGGRKSTPIVSLEVESFIPSLGLRRRMLNVRLYLKLLHRPESDHTCAVLRIESGNAIQIKLGPSKSFTSNVSNLMLPYHFLS